MGVGMTIQVKNFQQVRGELRAERERVRKQINKLTVRVAEIALGIVRERTPEDTGATARGWILRVIGGKGKGQTVTLAVITHPFNEEGARHPETGEVVNDGMWNLLEGLEHGTSAHEITPKEPGGLLSFMGADGTKVFTKRVAHPGTKAYAMTRVAADEADVLVGLGMREITLDLRKRLGK